VSMRHVLAGILKIIAVAVLLVGVSLYGVVNYSELTQELTCKGYWKEFDQNKDWRTQPWRPRVSWRTGPNVLYTACTDHPGL
jgi:hypothetical protein